MAINNRSFDTSEQVQTSFAPLGAVGGAAAEIHYLYVAPRPQLVNAIEVSCLGVTGSATANIMLSRFIVGTGSTIIGALCATLTLTAFGTSGLQAVSFLASVLLQANDALQVTCGGSNVGVSDMTVTTVVKNLQDIKTTFGA